MNTSASKFNKGRIIVRPMGGMGNQMYAYALGRSLSLRRNQPLLIDKSWIEANSAKRKLELDSLFHFQLECREWKFSRLPVLRLLLGGKLDRLFSWWSDLLPQGRKSILIETECRYDEWIHEIQSRTIYIRGGTWQSYKYFADFEAEVRRDFEFRPEVIASNQLIAERIRADPQSVSIHVRRGDYVNRADCGYTQGICTALYYSRAIDYFRSSFGHPTFYFFSDDIVWVRQEFGTGSDFVFVDHRESRANEIGFRDDGHNDMYLMSLCRNNIIANSTFSWWAAWLNKNPAKTIVAPASWYRGIADDSFIVKPEWTRISGV